MNKFTGLNSQQVEVNRQKFGSNALSQRETESFWSMYVESFKDKWIIILLAALACEVAFYLLGLFIPSFAGSDIYSSISIFAVILAVTGIGTYISYKQDRSFTALQEQASKTTSKVYRDGVLTTIPTDDIVVGDMVLLQAGDQIPADGILLDGTLKVDQSALNGESEEAKKITLDNNHIPDSKDLFTTLKSFRGSVVTSGEAVMEVTEVGDKTILGGINSSLQEKEERLTPSEVKLSKLANGIGVFGYVSGAIAALVNLAIKLPPIFREGATVGAVSFVILSSIVLGVTIVVMAVPEGLPLMNTLVQGLNVGKMLKAFIFVKNPKATETAGSINMLFTDKTGTLTLGKLTVTNLILGNGKIYDKLGEVPNTVQEDFIIGAGCNNAASVSGDGSVVGSNSTDRALMKFIAIDNKITIDNSRITVKEEFNSAVKYASVTLDDGVKYIKGAPDIIIDSSCTKYIDENGKESTLTKETKELLTKSMHDQMSRAMRLIGVVKEKAGVRTLITIICIRDDVRPDVKNSVIKLHKAGINVCMVTGDVLDTAIAIAKETGLIRNEEDICITHAELEAMSDEKLKEVLPHLVVVSRALPNDKKRLVEISQSLDLVVGMTGDGVNDAPALKKADVGFAMGDGTEVAKEAGDVVILNNSLVSIADAILYGRTMSKSVKKFIIFQLTVNVSTVFIAVIAPLLGWDNPFSIVQILWINMIMDTLAAIAFGKEPALERYMNEKPVPRSANILTSYLLSAIGVCGLFIGIGSLAILANIGGIHEMIGSTDTETIKTFMFSFFIFAVIWNSLNARTDSKNLFEHIGENKNFIIVMTAIAIVQTIIIEFGGKVFNTVGLNAKQYFMAFGFAALILVVDEIRKIFFKNA